MVSPKIENELLRTDLLRQEFERMVYARKECQPDERGWLLLGYWSLAIEHHTAMVGLIQRELSGSAAALLRPIMEATVRGHLVIFCSPEDLIEIRNDDYRVKFGTVGKAIDEHFGLDTLIQDFLKESSKILHSYTHGGILQIQRRFKGNKLQPNYPDHELVALINTATSGIFLLTRVVTKHFKYVDEWKRVKQVFTEWGQPPTPTP